MSEDRPLTRRFGSAKHPDRPVVNPAPDGVSDATLVALGKLGEALETVENARGLLYAFHRLCGSADRTVQEAVSLLHDAGADALADDIEEVLVGRDVVEGRWSFQLVEAYDEQYWQVFRAVEQHARRMVNVTRPHVYEAGMKHREQQQ